MYNRSKQLPIPSSKILIGVFMMVALMALAACGGVTTTKVVPKAVALVGTAEAFTSTAPDIDGDGTADESTCFTVDLIDTDTNEVLGDVTDCLSNITEDGDGLKIIGKTTFNFPEGQIVTRSETTVQPLLFGQNGFTHSTTAAPPLNGGSNILSATGDFAGATGSGTARLSGLVDMSQLGEEGILRFGYLFLIDL